MPQLDILTFFTHYIYILIFLFILFSLLISILMPQINKNFTLRVNQESFIEKNKKIKFSIFNNLFKL